MTKNLKPCPICGETAYWFFLKRSTKIKCTVCGKSLVKRGIGEECQNKLADLWNGMKEDPNKQRILNLVLTDHWFDEIKSGRKTHEYRKCSDFWYKRLGLYTQTHNHRLIVRFQKAYRKNPERMSFFVTISCIVQAIAYGYRIGGRRSWNAKRKLEYFDYWLESYTKAEKEKFTRKNNIFWL